MARYAISIVLGASVTFALLFVMQLLIATGRGAITEARAFRIVDFVRVERQSIVETKKEKPEKPPEPEQAPDMPSPDMLDSFDSSMAVSMSSPVINASLNIGGVGFGVSYGEYLPIV